MPATPGASVTVAGPPSPPSMRTSCERDAISFTGTGVSRVTLIANAARLGTPAGKYGLATHFSPAAAPCGEL